jgi:signal transduction histidine kinase
MRAAKAADAEPAAPPQSPFIVTNVSQVRRLASQNPDASYFIRLGGQVWWANTAQGRLVLKDDSGAEELEIGLQGQSIQLGDQVRLTGNGTIIRRGAAFQLGPKGPVVDNNGVHGMVEKSGSVYLNTGRHPLHLQWFNGGDNYGLIVEYKGPGVPRQSIPDSALFRMQADANVNRNWVHGLDYWCYPVSGEELPDFRQLTALKAGTTSNFDLSVIPRPEHVGLEFAGFLEVAQDGLYTFFTKSDDGSRLFVDGPPIQAEVVGQKDLPLPRQIAIGQPLSENDSNQWVQMEGRVTFAAKQSEGLRLELSAGAGRIQVEIADDSGLAATNLLHSRIRATGFCQSAFTEDGQIVPGVLLVAGHQQIEMVKPLESAIAASEKSNALPVLTTAVEVHRLKREEAQRGYTVKMRGVVTCVLPEHQAFTLQDSTRGLYVIDFSESLPAPPKIGQYLEVGGTTDPHLFAPVVNARQVTSLGAGHLPTPVRPAWDQLMNGSLDAQYVELEGVLTGIQTNEATFLTSGGIVKVDLRVNGLQKVEDLKQYENALVRVRGCLFATWDYLTHQVKMGEIRIYGADLLPEGAVLGDLFSVPRKTAVELRLFDPQAGAFQRVKVSGQVVYANEGECLMMADGAGLRFIPKNPAALEAGDLVEVVGFPDLLGRPSPVLREAVFRKTGHAPLPAARTLGAEDLIRAEHDATRVKVEGLLVNVRGTKPDAVLEMQNGVRTFMARTKDADDSVWWLSPGSRLALTGAYAGLGGNRAAGQEISSFELLLTSAADVKVLARSPWWTLKRLLIVLGALACVLAAAALWITQLHRQVEDRTAELGAQIQERQRIEQQRALEEERTRIAQDLHDELGSGITEIGMLAARAKSSSASDDKRSRHLDQVTGKARELVTALDEIVWAMNPRHDSLGSLVSYFSLYADRFLGLANIAWRLERPTGSLEQALDSRRRHQLFLAFKEALTNIVRHSGATKVRVHLRCDNGAVQMTITDNGRGLSAPQHSDGGLPSGPGAEDMDGMANMRARIEKLGGRFEIKGEAGRGTTVGFHVPFN